MNDLKPFSIDGQTVAGSSEITELDDTSKSLQKMSAKALALAVETPEDYERAGEMLHMVEGVTKVIEDITERFRKPAYEYYKGVMNTKKVLLKPGEDASKHLRGVMSKYVREQEQIRKAEEARLLAEARQKAEEEASAAFEAALEAGDELGAELAIEEASAAPSVDFSQLQEVTPEVQGISYRDNWKAAWDGNAEEALKKLCAAIAAGDAPAALVSLNVAEANRIAKALKGDMRIPGIKAVNEQVIVRR
jgi:hypothetical protein